MASDDINRPLHRCFLGPAPLRPHMTWAGDTEAALAWRTRLRAPPGRPSCENRGTSEPTRTESMGLLGGLRRETCLAVPGDLLGLEREVRSITVRAFVEAEGNVSRGVLGCGGQVKGGGERNRRGRVRRDFMLEAPTVEAAEVWVGALHRCMESLGRPKRLLILVNPFGGKKCAPKIFQDEVKPLLDAAGIYYVVQETKYRLHAQEISHKLDPTLYDGIVCVSGDGTLVEVVNGLLKRGDWQTAIKIPLGIVPAGTGNGMAKSLLDSVGETCSASNATFSIIQGHKQSLDVSTVKQGDTMFFSVLMLSWGLVADIDIESEKYRWMGSTRLDFYAFLRVINLRKYYGWVYFVPAPGYESYGNPIISCNENADMHAECKENSVTLDHSRYQGPTISFKSSEWRFIEGPFISVWLHNVPWASNDAMAAPEAKFSDGFVDVVVIKDCPRSALLALISKMNDGSYVKSPYVMYLKVKAFRLEPGQRVDNPSKGGIIDSDGEVIARGRGTYQCDKQGDLMEYGPSVQMSVDQGLATIFSPR